MIKIWAEIECDFCGACNHYLNDTKAGLTAVARKDGWFVTRSDKHFCSTKCLARDKLRRRKVV